MLLQAQAQAHLAVGNRKILKIKKVEHQHTEVPKGEEIAIIMKLHTHLLVCSFIIAVVSYLLQSLSISN